MDRHSEVELKFDAADVSLDQYQRLVEGLVVDGAISVQRYKVVTDVDTYYRIGTEPLRYRGAKGHGGELTYKRRKSQDSISDRVEINIPLKDTVEAKDVEALVTALGGSEIFHITKTSYIYHVAGTVDVGHLQVYHATLALYDVDDGVGTRRFLEIEIESISQCPPEVGMKLLDTWGRIIKNRLSVEGPLNQSLFEIYNKGAK